MTNKATPHPKPVGTPPLHWGAIFEHAAWGIRIGSSDGATVLGVNPRFAAMHGYTEDELTHRPIQDLYPPEHRAEALSRLRQVAQWGRQVYESVHLRKDGSRFPVLVDATMFTGPDGERYQAVNVLDLSDLKRAQSARQEMETRYRIVAEAASDGIVSIDSNSTILFANPAVERIFGYPPVEVLGRSLTMLMPEYLRRVHETGFARYLNTGVRHLNWQAVEVPGLHRDGYEIPLEVSFGEFVEGERRTFTGVIRDVSARKVTEEQLRQVQRMESVGRLAGGVAHEVNNQLSVVLGSADFLIHRTDLPAEVKQDLQHILKAAEQSTSIISQLLAFGRRQTLQPETVPINQVIEQFEPVIRRTIGKGIELRLKLSPDAGHVRVDRGQLEQVFLNLVLNAAHAMGKKGILEISSDRITLTGQMAVAHQPVRMHDADYTTVKIKDTGHGMDPATLARIFEPFFTTKNAGEGSGLGLSTAYGIITQSEGYLWAESQPGAGTTMTIQLPTVGPDPIHGERAGS